MSESGEGQKVDTPNNEPPIAQRTKDILNKKSSRRTFLRRARNVVVVAPVLTKLLEQAVYEGIRAGLTTPGATDTLVKATNKISEAAPNSENQQFRPLKEIINEGVNNFEERTGKKVYYKRSKDYKDKDYYSSLIDKIGKSSILPKLPKDIIEQFKSDLPYEAYQVYLSSEYRITSFENIFAQGSGFYERFKAHHPGLIREDNYVQSYGKLFEAMRHEGNDEIEKIVQFVEQTRAKVNKPISASYILSYILEQNHGDLGRSIFDTSVFLKFMSRNNPETGAINNDTYNEKWYQENILDEYQGPSYNSPPAGETSVNLIGKPYHSWNLIALNQFFPVELIQVAGIHRQLASFHEQGLGKSRSDLQTLQDMREIEKELLSYS